MTEQKKKSKTLVVYFSASGMTKRVAEEAARFLHADIFEIRPSQPYTDHDLDYIDKSTRVWEEHRNPKVRPSYEGNVENWKDYSTVLIGYPLWWAEAPHVVYTFVESHDFPGKRSFLSAQQPARTRGTAAFTWEKQQEAAAGRRASGFMKEHLNQKWTTGRNRWHQIPFL